MSKLQIQRQKHYAALAIGLIFVGVAIAAVVSSDRWWPGNPTAKNELEPTASAQEHHEDHDLEHGGDNKHEHIGHEHEENAEHNHSPAVHKESTSIVLSENGLKNIGFEPFVIKPTRFDKLVTLPAMIVERPGRSQIYVTAPLTGIITEIYSINGEAVAADQPLFEMRLTHEELVAAQRDFLRTVENLAVVNREIERLNTLEAGVIAGRRVLEQEYEKQKLEASLRAESQAMLLHGFTDDQVAHIRNTGRLLKTITVRAPDHVHTDGSCTEDHPYQIQRLSVAQGEHVEAGQELAVLADHCELHIEGLAFEDDAPLLRQAAEAGRKVSASLLVDDSPGATVKDLELLYVAGQIDPETRAFKFYLSLPNRIALDRKTSDGKRFVEWSFKPGQRMQLKVPIRGWEDQFVLPTTAVVEEDAETYVYRQEGDHFEQVAVQVIDRDQGAVVIADNGALHKGDVIAGKGAFQLHLAITNKSGGRIDPHAGHQH